MSDQHSRDRVLADAVLAGDRDAYRLLVESCTDVVLAACRRVLDDPDEAADVMQDAFVAAFRALPTWRGDGAFGAWVRRIALRLAFARLRSRKDLLTGEAAESALAATAADEGAEPEQLSLTREGHGELLTLIEALPEDYRRVIALRFSGELSIEEIARVTGAPEGTVKSRIHRALGMLRHQLRSESTR